MENNVGTLQTIPMGGATQNSTGGNRASNQSLKGQALTGFNRC